MAADQDFNGRWNLSVENEARRRAWWLEVTGAGTPNLKGRFVGAPGGDMNDIPEMTIQNGELRFVFQRQYGREGKGKGQQKGIYRARLVKGRLEGTFEVEGDAQPRLKFAGKRAPVIKEKDDGSWREGKPVALFNGKDLSGWVAVVPGRPLGWTVTDGISSNQGGANNLMTEKTFWNFVLHAEYRLGKGSNGGIGLRGRYEVQILEDFGRTPNTHTNGALYSRIVPAVNASKPPGEWQACDIRLVGRQVTVVLNGQKLIDKGEIEGLTAVAIDPDEAEPGPILLQGDHGPVEFRKLVLTPLVK
jgi:hypothetical protein